MSLVKNLYSKGKEVVTEVTTYWNKPAKGNYVSYKEILNYSIGGMGNNMILYVMGNMALGAGSLLLGSTLGLRPMHIQYMATFLAIVQVFMFIVRGKIVDNTRTKWGRFRPYIAFAGIPLIVLTAIFLFLDFEYMSYNKKFLLSFIFCTTIALLQPFLADTYTELRTVISPNSQERAKIISISSIVLSFAPTVVNLFVPILSKLTGGFTNINTYRYIVLPVGIIGLVLVFFAAFGCKERVIVSEKYVQKSSIFRDIVEVWKNKYWWIRTSASLIGFLESAYLAIFAWIFIYDTQNMGAYGLFQTILGTASLISMVTTPYILKRLGNRRIQIFHNALNVVLITIICFTFTNWVLFFVVYYLNTIVNQLLIVYDPAIYSEVKDYQQYISDKRMDFTFGAAGQITIPITLATGYAIPFFYELMGVTTNYDIIFDPRIRYGFFWLLCGLSVLGSALNLIPFFFYKLSREKHKNIITALRYRAVLEDYYLGDNIDPHRIVELVESVNETERVRALPMPELKLLKKEYRAALKMQGSNKEETKAYKLAKKLAKQMPHKTTEEKLLRENAIADAKKLLVTKNTKKEEVKKTLKAIKDAEYVINYKEGIKEIWDKELTKYDSKSEQVKISCYEKLLSFKVSELKDINVNCFEECFANIFNNAGLTKKESRDKKKYEKWCKNFIKSVEKMKESILKVYPDGVIIEPNKEDIEAVNAMSEETKEDRKLKRVEIARIAKINDNYHKAVGFYVKADEKLIKYHASKLYDEVAKLYDQSVLEVEEIDAKQAAEAKAYREEKKAELIARRQERRERKNAKKNKKGDK